MRRFELEVGVALLSLVAGILTWVVTWLITFLWAAALMASGLNSPGPKPRVSLQLITYLAWAIASAVTLWIWKLLQERLLPVASAKWRRSPVLLGSVAVLLAVVPPTVYYKAQRTLWQETRRPWPHPATIDGRTKYALDNNQQTLILWQYRFHPTIVLELTNERPRYTSRFKFLGIEIEKVDRVDWYNGNSAVRIELECRHIASMTQTRHESVFFDFDTSLFFSTLSMPQSEFNVRMHSWISSLTMETTREGIQ